MGKALLDRVISKSWVLDVRRPQCWLAENTQIIANDHVLQKKYLGFDCSYKNYLILNGDEYYLESEGETYDHVFEHEFRRDPRFLDRFTKTINSLAFRADSYRKRLVLMEIKGWSNHRLATEISRFQDYYTLSYLPAWSRPDGFLESAVKELLKKEIKFTHETTEEIFPKLANYPSATVLAYSNEPLDLLKIARVIKNGKYSLEHLPDSLNRKFLGHVDNYSWLKTLAQTEYVFFTLEDYRERLRLMLEKNVGEEINRIERVRLQNDKDYETICKTYHFSPSLRKIVNILREFIYLRTHTTEVSDHLLITGRQTLLKEAAKRLGLTDEQVVTLTTSEVTQLLEESKKMAGLADIITNRQEAYAFVLIDRKLTILIGKEAQEFYGQFSPVINKRVAKVNAVIITGAPASVGRATGPAKILFTHNDINKVEKGDILVAPVTTPDYILAMEKAAAFVTDEGGITSHAAIVAREFGVPCVVGTKVATKIFKDGDLIEVDAGIGVVRRIT
jgi:phosphohistidine swiveling domain-containing protein